jgi:hypothetical protein
MSPFKIGFKIWGIAVLLNACYFGLFALVQGDLWRVLLAGGVFLIGALAGLPLLFLLVKLLKVLPKLPYSLNARIIWLGFCMSIGVVMFYSLLMLIVSGRIYLLHPSVQPFAGITIAAFITSLWWSRKSLREVKGINEYSIN